MLSIYSVTNKNDYLVGLKENKPKQSTQNNIFDFEKYQNKHNDIMSKFYTVDFDAIEGRKYIIDYSKTEININKEIEDTKQVKNDCWLLAGINALSNTEKGKKYIKQAITKLPDGNINVYFKGTNTSITIPKIALAAAKESKYYVKGDDDMLAIEVATEYYKKQLIKNGTAQKHDTPNIIDGKHSNGNINDPIAGGFPSDILYLVTGKKSMTHFNAKNGSSEKIKNLIKDMQKNQNDYALICNFKKAKNGLYIHHAYTIKEINNDSVILINPQNTSKPESIKIEDFYENVSSITTLKV